MTAALEVRGLSVQYGGVAALSQVDLTVERGELVGLVGPNGAGKTTLIDAVTGFARSTGQVRLDGRAMTSCSPRERARQGLSRTWQLGELFEDLSVAENLSVAANRSSPRALLGEILQGASATPHCVVEILDRLGLAHLADASAAELSEGQRKLVGVGRALASDPVVILLDEPAAGLDEHESRQLGDTLRTLVSDEVSMVLVDHDIELVMSTCDRIVVLDFGRVIANGTPQEVRQDADVVRVYLGGSDPDPHGDSA